MPLFGQCFLSDVLKRPVYDPRGDVAGRLSDVIVVKGEPLARISAILVARRGRTLRVRWDQVDMFNKRILSILCESGAIEPYEGGDLDLLAVRDILDKQIVDANGAKVVRVNDIRLEGYAGEALLTAADVGVRGLLRRLGIERRSEQFFTLMKVPLPYNLISWQYIQPLTPKLKAIALTVPRQMVADLHPADLADIISQVSRDEGRSLLTDLDVKTAAEALSELEPQQQVELITGIDAEQAADILEEMPPDEASDVLGDLPTDKAREILDRIEEEEAEDIEELLGYEEDTAGGLMTNVFVAYPPHITVAEAIERFRAGGSEDDPVHEVHVVDGAGRLVGSVSLRDLLLAEPSAALETLAERRQRTVTPEADERTIASVMAKYNLIALPVVDTDRRLLGVVTIDDVIERLLPAAQKKRKGV
jgi:magnesium transporter